MELGEENIWVLRKRGMDQQARRDSMHEADLIVDSCGLASAGHLEVSAIPLMVFKITN